MEMSCRRLNYTLSHVPDDQFCGSTSANVSTSLFESSSSAKGISNKAKADRGECMPLDKIPDGFYLINGMDPYIWTMCTDIQDNVPKDEVENKLEEMKGMTGQKLGKLVEENDFILAEMVEVNKILYVKFNDSD